MILDTDASFVAIGTLLRQKYEIGIETFFGFGSRILNDYEKGYCITRKKPLALHEFIFHFKHYLYAKRILRRTDHKVLTYMKNS